MIRTNPGFREGQSPVHHLVSLTLGPTHSLPRPTHEQITMKEGSTGLSQDNFVNDNVSLRLIHVLIIHLLIMQGL